MGTSLWTSSQTRMLRTLLFTGLATLAVAAPAAEAEAEAEADPALVYTNTGVHGVYPYGAVPSVYHHAPVVKTVKTVIPAVQTVVHKPVVYSGVHHPAAVYSGVHPYAGVNGLHYYGKRKAEAEPEADAKADPYLIYGYGNGYGNGYGAGYGYHPYGYNPYYTLPIVKPAEAAEKAVAVEEKKTVVPSLLYHPGYPYGYQGYPLVNTVAGTKTVLGAPLAHYGHYYGKREAEAEPAAEPEADAYYGYYGHGLGYAGYGHGYGYAGHGYGYGRGYGYGHGYGYYG